MQGRGGSQYPKVVQVVIDFPKSLSQGIKTMSGPLFGTPALDLGF